jgi:tetratricopeptide (TPR) repeat protein
VRNPFDLLGICFMIKSYHSPSDEDFDQALNCYFSLKGEFKFEINVSLGNLLYNKGYEDEAIIELEEALEDRPLEKIYEKLGRLMLNASNR